MSESFSPLYFYTDIKPNSKGEVFINYKKGGNIVYSKILSKQDKDENNWKGQEQSLSYDNYNSKITFSSTDTNSCSNGCELYIGINISEKINVGDDFSLFLRYYDSPVTILPNEFVFGSLFNQSTSHYYNITIQKNTTNVTFTFDSGLYDFIVKNGDKQLDVVKTNKLYEINSNSTLQGQILSFEITPKNDIASFYSFKIDIPETNSIQRITSDNINYCQIKLTTDLCYYAIPIKNYENISQVLFYAINEDYPKTFSAHFYSFLTDYDNIHLLNLSNIQFHDSTKENRHLFNVTANNTKDQYLIIKIKSNKVGNIKVIISKYPSYESRTLIPNSDILIYSNTSNIHTFKFNENDNLEYVEFVNISNGGNLQFSENN
jgi:hypothetical protein